MPRLDAGWEAVRLDCLSTSFRSSRDALHAGRTPKRAPVTSARRKVKARTSQCHDQRGPGRLRRPLQGRRRLREDTDPGTPAESALGNRPRSQQFRAVEQYAAGFKQLQRWYDQRIRSQDREIRRHDPRRVRGKISLTNLWGIAFGGGTTNNGATNSCSSPQARAKEHKPNWPAPLLPSSSIPTRIMTMFTIRIMRATRSALHPHELPVSILQLRGRSSRQLWRCGARP